VRLINKIKVSLTGSQADPSSWTPAQKRRTIWIFVSLVTAMSLGALALMAVDSQSFSAGPFSLASYTSLNSAENITDSSTPNTYKWQQIHIVISDASAGSIEQLAAANDLANAKDLNYHFVVFNGIDGIDGEICATDKWLSQRRTLYGAGMQDNSPSIRICVVTGSIFTTPTDCQIKRAAALVESLARKFNIPTSKIRYPANWQL